MPLLLVLGALLLPRLLIVALWLFTNWFGGLFSGVWWPIAGFVFAPTTLLWCSVVERWFNGHWGLIQLVGLIITLVIDLAPARKRRAIEAAA